MKIPDESISDDFSRRNAPRSDHAGDRCHRPRVQPPCGVRPLFCPCPCGRCRLVCRNHFEITTDTNEFISATLPWRQRLTAFNKAFPQRDDNIVVVIDGASPELAESAAAQISEKLRGKPDLFTSRRSAGWRPLF